MSKRLISISAFVVVAACGSGAAFGIATLGPDFIRAFNQSPNDSPLFADSDPVLNLTPKAEPFNP